MLKLYTPCPYGLLRQGTCFENAIKEIDTRISDYRNEILIKSKCVCEIRDQVYQTGYNKNLYLDACYLLLQIKEYKEMIQNALVNKIKNMNELAHVKQTISLYLLAFKRFVTNDEMKQLTDFIGLGVGSHGSCLP